MLIVDGLHARTDGFPSLAALLGAGGAVMAGESPIRVRERSGPHGSPVRVRYRVPGWCDRPAATLRPILRAAHQGAERGIRLRNHRMTRRRSRPAAREFYWHVGLAGNPSTPADLLQRLSGSPYDEVRVELSGRAELPEDDLTWLFGQTGEVGWHRLLVNPSCPGNVLVTLAESGDESVAADAVRHMNYPADGLGEIGRGVPVAGRDLSVPVLANPSLPRELLEAGSADHRVEARCRIAGNPAIPPDLAVALCGDPSAVVRRSLAQNPAVDTEIAERLSRDPESMVRLGILLRSDADRPPSEALIRSLVDAFPDEVAGAPGLTAEVCAELLPRLDEAGWENLATNPGIPETVLDLVHATGGPRVRALTCAHPRCPSRLLNAAAESDTIELRAAAARNPHVPKQRAEALASDDSPLVRKSLAKNPALPPRLLVVLAHDTARSVRAEAALNPACDPVTLESLLHDPDDIVAMKAAYNPALPVSVMNDLTKALPRSGK